MEVDDGGRNCDQYTHFDIKKKPPYASVRGRVDRCLRAAGRGCSLLTWSAATAAAKPVSASSGGNTMPWWPPFFERPTLIRVERRAPSHSARAEHTGDFLSAECSPQEASRCCKRSMEQKPSSSGASIPNASLCSIRVRSRRSNGGIGVSAGS